MDQSDRGSFDITQLKNSMKQELQSLSPLSPTNSICRAPKRQREVKAKAYIPKIVSIGPFHHGRKGLKAMEEHKKRYLNDFITWTNLSLGFYIKVVKENEEKLRACYQEAIGFSSKKFVEVIVVDAAFIVGVLIKGNFGNLRENNDYVFSRLSRFTEIKGDMFLLENQLPFFILVEFFGYVRLFLSQFGETPSFLRLLYNFCQSLAESDETERKLEKIESCDVAHFLDFLIRLIVPLEVPSEGRNEILYAPCITELYQAGVKFENTRGGGLDLEFERGILKMPRFKLNWQKEILLRNIIAFEECFGDTRYITDYIVIMSQLLSTQNDVDLLVKNKTLENRKNIKETLLGLTHELAAESFFYIGKFCFAGLCDKLNKHCDNSRRKWIVDLKQNYFNTPWTTISVIAGFVLLVLTLIQTVCSVISVKSSNQNGNKH